MIDEVRPDYIKLDTVPEPLRSLIRLSSDTAADRFRRDGFSSPMWHAMTAKGEFILISDPPVEDKDTSALLVRAMLELNKTTNVVFSDEAWKLGIGADASAEDVMRDHGGGIRHHPDRTEVIMFVCENESILYHGERAITRPRHGKPKLGPLRLYMPQSSEGRFVSWLAVKGRPS